MTKSIFLLFVLTFNCAVLAQEESKFLLDYIDPIDKGALSTKAFTTSDGQETTVGEYRKEMIERAIRAVSLQFNHVVSHKLEIEFGVPEGFGAVTLGPIFSEHNEFKLSDEFGFLEVGRQYPSTLVSSLIGKRSLNEIDADATVSFADNEGHLVVRDGNTYPYIVYAAYHELMHVLGFLATDCLGNCLPEPVSTDSHFSQNIYVGQEEGPVSFESLTLEQKTEAYMSTNNLWFGGSQASKDAATNELTSGHFNGYVYMFATPTEINGVVDVDAQSGSHFSFDVLPAQLMHSAGALTEDLGMAAYLLCDAGWCQDGGKVIEQSVSAELNENASSETQTVIDIVVSENLNVGVDEFVLIIRPGQKVSLIEFQDPNDICVEIDTGYKCTSALAALTKVNLRMLVSPADEYVIAGELRSTGFNVDRNGFNNLLDVTLIKEKEEEPTPLPIPTPNASDEGSGGAISMIILLLLMTAILRKYGRRSEHLIA